LAIVWEIIGSGFFSHSALLFMLWQIWFLYHSANHFPMICHPQSLLYDIFLKKKKKGHWNPWFIWEQSTNNVLSTPLLIHLDFLLSLSVWDQFSPGCAELEIIPLHPYLINQVYYVGGSPMSVLTTFLVSIVPRNKRWISTSIIL
jgi:hypothetical protein